MENIMNVFADLQMKSAAFKLNHFSGFPANPSDGELAVVDGALYCYSMLEGKLQWMPLTNKREIFVFNQETESDRWIIDHDLGTTDFIYAVYDINNMLQITTVSMISVDQIEVNLTYPIKGKCVIIASSNSYSGYQSCSDTSLLSDDITYGTTEPTGTETSTLYFQVGE